MKKLLVILLLLFPSHIGWAKIIQFFDEFTYLDMRMEFLGTKKTNSKDFREFVRKYEKEGWYYYSISVCIESPNGEPIGTCSGHAGGKEQEDADRAAIKHCEKTFYPGKCIIAIRTTTSKARGGKSERVVWEKEKEKYILQFSDTDNIIKGKIGIEGIKLGDSALDFYSERQIKQNNVDSQYAHLDKQFAVSSFGKRGNKESFKQYDRIQIGYKRNDKKYIINYIAGAVFTKINECHQDRRKIVNSFSEILKDAEEHNPDTGVLHGDTTGKSKIYQTNWTLRVDGKITEIVSVECYDWGPNMRYDDNLRVSTITEAFGNWISSTN